MAETELTGNRPSSSADGGGEVTVIESPRSPFLHSALAFAVWIGCIHLCVAAVFTAVFLLPLSQSISVFAFLLLLSVAPVDSDSSLGLKLRRSIFKHVCGYFPITVHVEDYKALVPHRTYIFAFEPHSVLPLGVVSLIHLINLLPLPKFKVLASSAVFRTPFLRQVWTWMGLTSATRKNFTSLLKDGYSCGIIPGGAEEAQHLVLDYEILFLKARKGFVRTAMEMGVPLVPVFSFGQSKIYSWWKPNGKLFVQIRKAVKFTPMLFWGAWGTPLAYRIPLHVVIGKPIEVEKNPQPSPEEVEKVLAQFLDALQNLFERHKTRVGYPDLQLKII